MTQTSSTEALSPQNIQTLQRKDDPKRAYKVLIADLVGLKFDVIGRPDHSEVQAYIESKGGEFHDRSLGKNDVLETGKLHFFYQPDLSREQEILDQTADGQYDATIAAATSLPEAAKFDLGGVRIGAGTGNMGSASWGGGNGEGGVAALMNTPSFNSRATAQMAMKALLKVCPDLPVDEMHDKVVAGTFDTGRNLCYYPTERIESKRIALIGYGNIGRELAKLAQAFGMTVIIYARLVHKDWIESEGFIYASTPVEAACGADVISVHTGLGSLNVETGRFSNVGLIDEQVFEVMNPSSIVINYDRGEIIDSEALDKALTTGKISYAGIDADLFIDASTGEFSGPMLPYRAMEVHHRGKMELLPHAAADTEHLSRVQGAMQAVDQIYDVIQYRSIVNLKGDLPESYTDAGTKTVNGVGRVTSQVILQVGGDKQLVSKLADMLEKLALFWRTMADADSEQSREDLTKVEGGALVMNINQIIVKLEALGLRGPYAD